jgi:hypothetical protein
MKIWSISTSAIILNNTVNDEQFLSNNDNGDKNLQVFKIIKSTTCAKKYSIKTIVYYGSRVKNVLIGIVALVKTIMT